MSERTCSMRGCNKKHNARGLCQSHYHKAKAAGTLPPLQLKIPLSETHSLSNIDRVNAVADCSVCGPKTPIRVGKLGANGKRGRGSECKVKRTIDNAARPDQTLEARRVWQLRRYGLSVDEYDAMVEQQEARCLICKDQPERLFVDHDHGTGRVRGLLCRECNLALGFLRDRPEAASAAAHYLLNR